MSERMHNQWIAIITEITTYTLIRSIADNVEDAKANNPSAEAKINYYYRIVL